MFSHLTTIIISLEENSDVNHLALIKFYRRRLVLFNYHQISDEYFEE